jgi:phosphohistidine swiveling domain-containing protein
MTERPAYTLPDPALEAYTWVYENEHHPAAEPPLTRMPPSPGPDGVPSNLSINGYNFFRWSESAPAGPSLELPRGADGALARWNEEWLPQIEALIAELRAFDPATVAPGAWERTLRDQLAANQQVFWGVHGRTLMPVQRAAQRLEAGYADAFGSELRLEALALLQGFPNCSLRRATLLWELSRLVREDAVLAKGLARTPPDLSAGANAVAFQAGLQTLLSEFGDTTEMFLADRPTWNDDQTVPLAMVRGYASRPDGEGPAEAASRQRLEREQLEAQLRAAATTNASTAPLLPLLAVAQQYLPLLEDHNYLCDQRLTAASSARWRRIGSRLVAEGKLPSADAVFLYTFDELIATLEGGGPQDSKTLAVRRAELAACRASPPPPVLGRPLAQAAHDRSTDAATARVISGSASSPGSYRGRARVITSVTQADRLAEGDVLVCVSTDPGWTPYFGQVAAVVTDAGGVLSHCAVVAREFGIPAVTGTRTATALIADGATVTVDGSTGVVIVEE